MSEKTMLGSQEIPGWLYRIVLVPWTISGAGVILMFVGGLFLELTLSLTGWTGALMQIMVLAMCLVGMIGIVAGLLLMIVRAIIAIVRR